MSNTTVCANVMCANKGKMNNLQLETKVTTNDGTLANDSPLLKLMDTSDTAVFGPILQLQKNPVDADDLSATGMDELDQCGTIKFVGNNATATAANRGQITYGSITVIANEVSDGTEAGTMTLSVAENDGTVTAGLTLTGSASSDGVVNATLGAGATSTVTIPGSLVATSTSIGELSSIPHSTAGGFDSLAPKSIMGTVDSATATGYNMLACDKLFHFLSAKDSLTAAEATTLFGTSATASTTATVDEAVADAANTPGFDATLKVQFLTGGFGGAAKDIGNVNPFADLGDNGQQMVIFGSDVASTGTGALTLTLAGSDRVDSSGSSIAFTGVDNDVFTVTAAAGGDGTVDIVITPANGTIIKHGSFLYKEHTGANLVNIRGYLKIGGVALTSATC